MTNWQTFTITYTIPTGINAIIGLDGYVDFYDKKGKEKIICESSPFGLLKENQRIQIDVEKLKSRYFESLIHKEDDIIRRVGSCGWIADRLIPSSSTDVITNSPSSMTIGSTTLTRENYLTVARGLDDMVEQSGGRNEYTASIEAYDNQGRPIKFSLSSKRIN